MKTIRLLDSQTVLPPVEDMDSILARLDKAGKVEMNRAFSSGAHSCEVMTKILGSTCFIKAEGQTRHEAAAACLTKLILFQSLERE